jgi:hypothetical protein
MYTEDTPIRVRNTSRVYFNGSVWNTSKSGEITVLSQVDEYSISKNNSKYYSKFVVQFTDGHKTIATMSRIKRGLVLNRFYPFLYQRGFVGEGEHRVSLKGKTTKIGTLWHNIFSRCYDEELQKTKNSSYKDCEIDIRWWCFQDFCGDIMQLEGYTDWINGTMREYDIDKDTKIKGNKIYSKDTCVFITHKENTKKGNRRHTPCLTGLTYIGTRLSDGYVEEFTNQAEFARKHNLHAGHVTACTRGEEPQHKGWIFQVKI